VSSSKINSNNIGWLVGWLLIDQLID